MLSCTEWQSTAADPALTCPSSAILFSKRSVHVARLIQTGLQPL